MVIRNNIARDEDGMEDLNAFFSGIQTSMTDSKDDEQERVAEANNSTLETQNKRNGSVSRELPPGISSESTRSYTKRHSSSGKIPRSKTTTKNDNSSSSQHKNFIANTNSPLASRPTSSSINGSEKASSVPRSADRQRFDVPNNTSTYRKKRSSLGKNSAYSIENDFNDDFDDSQPRNPKNSQLNNIRQQEIDFARNAVSPRGPPVFGSRSKVSSLSPSRTSASFEPNSTKNSSRKKDSDRLYDNDKDLIDLETDIPTTQPILAHSQAQKQVSGVVSYSPPYHDDTAGSLFMFSDDEDDVVVQPINHNSQKNKNSKKGYQNVDDLMSLEDTENPRLNEPLTQTIQKPGDYSDDEGELPSPVHRTPTVARKSIPQKKGSKPKRRKPILYSSKNTPKRTAKPKNSTTGSSHVGRSASRVTASTVEIEKIDSFDAAGQLSDGFESDTMPAGSEEMIMVEKKSTAKEKEKAQNMPPPSNPQLQKKKVTRKSKTQNPTSKSHRSNTAQEALTTPKSLYTAGSSFGSKGTQDHNTDTLGARRSTRLKTTPLKWWKNERICYSRSYEHNLEGSAIKKIIHPDDSEDDNLPKSTKRGRSKASRKTTTNKRRKTSKYGQVYDDAEGYDSNDELVAEKVLDKAKDIVLEGSASTNVVSDSLESDDEDYTKNIEVVWSRGFDNYHSLSNSLYNMAPMYSDAATGSACGTLVFKPNAQKPVKSTSDSICFFHVMSGAFHITIADAEFTVLRGGTFVVPKGNTYSIKNTMPKESKLFFVQHRDINKNNEDE